MSEPVFKTLSILELLQVRRGQDLTLKEIQELSDIPMATLQRILGALVERGYLHKQDKRYEVNYLLEVGNRYHGIPIYGLRELMSEMIDRGASSVETISVRENELHWDEKLESESLEIRIAATKGYTRDLYELDAPSRAYLSTLGEKKLKSNFNVTSFYRSPTDRSELRWVEILSLLDGDDEKYSVDEMGNENGVRRYAASVKYPDGGFGFLLCIAEAALASSKGKAHVEKMGSLLVECADSLSRMTSH